MIAEQQRVAAGIASRVRTERRQRRWTLDELATRSTVSRRLLVQIEQAEANPSLATLLKLAAAFEVTLTDLVSEQPAPRALGVVAGEDALTLWSTPAGSSARLLVNHGPVELWSWTLAPGDRRDGEPHRRGSLELLHVQTGGVTVEAGGERAEIDAGDSGWFDATTPHAYTNPGSTTATFTLVVFEPV